MTDTDNTLEGAPTEPLPVAESAGVTPPLPAAAPAVGVPGVAAPAAERQHKTLSTGGIVAIALAGAMALAAVSFGAGWGAHGLASRFGDRRAFVAQRGMTGYGQSYGNGYHQGQAPDGEQGWRDGSANGRGMAPRGGWGDQQSQDGWGQRGVQQNGAGVCPGQTW